MPKSYVGNLPLSEKEQAEFEAAVVVLRLLNNNTLKTLCKIIHSYANLNVATTSKNIGLQHQIKQMQGELNQARNFEVARKMISSEPPYFSRR
jgi:hypothetical protein